MIQLAVAAAEEHAAPLLMPNWAFALTAFIVFLLLGIVTWSFRDVANRHAQKVDAAGADHGAHSGAGERSGH
ncbi:MAG TPA: hypothetical protein PJ998_07305 [Terrimesophilobacter sp.]|nr:hypothetical protein [Terrimesophilobacter sp.]